MQLNKPPSLMLIAVLFAATLAASRAAETEDAVSIQIEDAAAKTGEKAVIRAKVVPKAGYQIAQNYRNRIMTLSSADNEVEFAGQVVRGEMQDGSLLFKVVAAAKKPGAHAINGIIRFAFVSELDGSRRLDIKWAPLIATLTGTE